MSTNNIISNVRSSVSNMFVPSECTTKRDSFFDILLEVGTIIVIILAMFILSIYTTQSKYQILITWYFWFFIMFLIFLKLLPSCNSNRFLI